MDVGFGRGNGKNGADGIVTDFFCCGINLSCKLDTEIACGFSIGRFVAFEGVAIGTRGTF